MNGIARVLSSSALALSLALLLSACGDAPATPAAAPAGGSGSSTSPTSNGAAPQKIAEVAAADTTADLVLRAEKSWSEADKANSIELYNKAILSATKEGNSVQAQIFTKRLQQIEKAK